QAPVTTPHTSDPVPDRAQDGPFLDRSLRRWMLDRFKDWLDEAFDEERPPEGLAGEILAQMRADDGEIPGSRSAPDLIELWGSLAKVAHEVHIQGRSLKDLGSAVATFPDVARQV